MWSCLLADYCASVQANLGYPNCSHSTELWGFFLSACALISDWKEHTHRGCWCVGFCSRRLGRRQARLLPSCFFSWNHYVLSFSVLAFPAFLCSQFGLHLDALFPLCPGQVPLVRLARLWETLLLVLEKYIVLLPTSLGSEPSSSLTHHRCVYLAYFLFLPSFQGSSPCLQLSRLPAYDSLLLSDAFLC